MTSIRTILALTAFTLSITAFANAQQPVHTVSTPATPPAWAVMERALLDANEKACKDFFEKYFDQNGFLLCVERWGGDDGPDDAIENCNDWPILHALGADASILEMYKHAWEGHLRQYTLAKTTHVPFARDGMYYKEFPVTFDWLHNGEGLTVFNLQGLSDPYNSNFHKRTRRFAGFYMNEDPGAPNYDAEHRIIRSMFNGSRGPLMRKATAVDWAGDPIEVKNRFKLGHGEESYEQMLFHFKDYNDIIGDLPQNLLATSLGLNAYMMSGEDKYRDWVLEYIDAWRERCIENDYIIPSNIGLDGKIGSATDGKWYGGVYGWAFTVEVPQDGSFAHRNTTWLGFTGFMNAYLLTGDDKYLDPWRQQIQKINAQGKLVDGVMQYPTMFGDDGWYNFQPARYSQNALELYYLSQKPEDREAVGPNAWLDYLDGNNDGYPLQALSADFANIQLRAKRLRDDETTPDTRLADDPMSINPASVRSLISLMLGGIHPGHRGSPLYAAVRYFDRDAQRAGIPDDVAALVTGLTAESISLQLVNTSQTQSREVTIQAGSYGQHEFGHVTIGTEEIECNSRYLTVILEPGCATNITATLDQYVNQPTMQFPWK